MSKQVWTIVKQDKEHGTQLMAGFYATEAHAKWTVESALIGCFGEDVDLPRWAPALVHGDELRSIKGELFSQVEGEDDAVTYTLTRHS